MTSCGRQLDIHIQANPSAGRLRPSARAAAAPTLPAALRVGVPAAAPAALGTLWAALTASGECRLQKRHAFQLLPEHRPTD